MNEHATANINMKGCSVRSPIMASRLLWPHHSTGYGVYGVFTSFTVTRTYSEVTTKHSTEGIKSSR